MAQFKLPRPFDRDFGGQLVKYGDAAVWDVMDQIDEGIAYELALCAHRVALAIELKALLRMRAELKDPKEHTVLQSMLTSRSEAEICEPLEDLDVKSQVTEIVCKFDPTQRVIRLKHINEQVDLFRTNLAHLFFNPHQPDLLPNCSPSLTAPQRADLDNSKIIMSYIRDNGLHALARMPSMKKTMEEVVDSLRDEHGFTMLGRPEEQSVDESSEGDESDDEDDEPPAKRQCVDEEQPGSTDTPQRVPAATQHIDCRCNGEHAVTSERRIKLVLHT